ncbi:hypothetical protein ADILRU_2338 [Leifsonia rubra CMS 76R]|nr:hypothetical protein ADILRU_2338 [Leifsonia rubra CMS 76R]
MTAATLDRRYNGSDAPEIGGERAADLGNDSRYREISVRLWLRYTL